MTTKRKKNPATSKSVAPRGARTLSGQEDSDNLPAVSRQTAGGIAGAAIGGMVAGPVGAVVTGVAGALVGSASAAGNRPLKRTVDGIRSVAEKPARRAYSSMSAAFARHRVSSKKKATARKVEARKDAAQKATAKKATAEKAAAKKAKAEKAAAKARARRKPSKAAK